MIQSQPTLYHGHLFRSRLEARWAYVFDQLEIEWVYEPQHYTFGLKNEWGQEEEEELQEQLDDAWDEEDRRELRREAWWKKRERLMYLPDFWVPDFECWVEIKGKPPTFEEENKARKLNRQTSKPVHILWGNIPDPRKETLGDCAEVYGGDMNLITLMILECGLKSVDNALIAARQRKFK